MSARGDGYPGAVTAAVRATVDNELDVGGWPLQVRDTLARGVDVDGDTLPGAPAVGGRL